MSMARVRGIEVAYEEVGEGPAVVLLHGFPFNRSLWRGQAEALSDSWRVITPDLRGHGGTTVVPGTATMEEMAGDLAALLDELRVERAVVGGLSMGGYVTLAFYREFRERVRGLVLADTRPQADTEEGRRTREESARRVLAEGTQSIADAMIPKLLAPSTLEGMPGVVVQVRGMILGTKPEGVAAALLGMTVRRDQRDLMGEINVPVLVLVGSEDTLTPPVDSETMHRLIKNSRLEIIEGSGHVSNLERPAQFNRALAEFLAGLQGVEGV